jgi:hypothetical protein
VGVRAQLPLWPENMSFVLKEAPNLSVQAGFDTFETLEKT